MRDGGCPCCGTQLKPYLTAHDGYIRINWQELRILAAYSMRWMETFTEAMLQMRANADMVRTVEQIIRQLQIYQPKGCKPLLNQPITTPVVELEINPDAKLEPDATGNIPSPFQRKNL
jgi:hypothetical protein